MLDLCFLIGLAIAFFIGYKAGFLRALVSFIGIVVSAVGGYLLYPYVTPFLMKTPLFDLIYGWVLTGLEGYLSGNEAVSQMEALFVKYNVNTTTVLMEKMASGITTVIFNVISVFLIIFLIKLAIMILKKVTNVIHHIPVLGTINRIFGMALTGASFVTVCFIVVAVMLLPPSNTSELSRTMCQKIDESAVVKQVMDYNFFVNYKSLSQGL